MSAVLGWLARLCLLSVVCFAGAANAQKQGGVLRVTHRDNPEIAWENVEKPAPVQAVVPTVEWIQRAHFLAEQVGLKVGYFPVWDLAARKSASLFLSKPWAEPSAGSPLCKGMPGMSKRSRTVF